MAGIREEPNKYYLEFKKDVIRFEPSNKVTSVFFDDTNKQVFAVRSGGVTGVVVKGPDINSSIVFRMEDRGQVKCIKFSPGMRILAVQRSFMSVEFMNFREDGSADDVEYSQSCKGKSNSILTFVWTSPTEIAYITNQGVEYYQLNAEKRSLKCLKTFGYGVSWYIWSAENSILLLSSGSLGNSLQPIHLRSCSFIKYTKFEVDLAPKVSLPDRDVTIAKLYDSLYVLILRHQSRSSHYGAEVVLYQLNRDSPSIKTHILRLGVSGRFAINVVDNMVVVHHQSSKVSLMFDIEFKSESEGGVYYHDPILPPLSIKPCTLRLPSINFQNEVESCEHVCEMYAAKWVIFQPDIIIDPKLGCLWNLEVKLNPIVNMLPDKHLLIKFLLMRRSSKAVVLSVLKQMLLPTNQESLTTLSSVFDLLNIVFKKLEHSTLYTDVTTAPSLTGEFIHITNASAVVDQSDMYSHVFSAFSENMNVNHKYMVAVLISYISSLNHHNIPVQYYLIELLINTLVSKKQFCQLHQFLQYHVLSDSKPLACLMLSLESVYEPAYQLALDMLKRLSTANDEIVEVLLSKQQLLPALRFLRSINSTNSIAARKFLEAALNTSDNLLFYTVFKFFEQRNLQNRGDPSFLPGEHCDKYISHFEDVFGQQSFLSSQIGT